jgi:hypothetical protein
MVTVPVRACKLEKLWTKKTIFKWFAFHTGLASEQVLLQASEVAWRKRMQFIEAEKKEERRICWGQQIQRKNWGRNASSSSSGSKDVHCQYMNKDFYRFILIYLVRSCNSLSEKLHDWVQCEGKTRCVGGQEEKTYNCGRGANNNCSRIEVCAIFLSFQNLFNVTLNI